MPCILKIKVIGARDLPVMDKASELTDAYVEVRFADFEAQRTTVCRKTLNPTWNEDFRFEVSDDADLQNEPLELKVLDYDAITANDSVGSVIIDLNPLLPVNSPWQIAGWFPIYDTIRGIRGELNVQVKLQFFGDVNPFKDSSAGIMFFSTNSLPAGYQIVAMHGFVDAIVNEDDPEYHWSDSFRTQRSSNEARQRLLFRLSGQLRRLLGKETLELGGNAVLGYQQCFDLESEEHAITARAIGTAVKLAMVSNPTPPSSLARPFTLNDLPTEEVLTSVLASDIQSISPANILSQDLGGQMIASGQGSSPGFRGSDMAVTKRRNSGFESDGSSNASSSEPSVTSGAKNSLNNYKYLEQQLFTLHEFPPGSILNLGGIVSARSVKLIDNDDVETRDAWWDELRNEIKSHARQLDCSHIIGYQENATINDELIVLSAYGTAANLDMNAFSPAAVLDAGRNLSRSGSISRSYVDNPMDAMASSFGGTKAGIQNSFKEQPYLDTLSKRKNRRKQPSACRMCHIPFHRKASPFPMSLVKCQQCKRRYVPEILLSTVEPPAELKVVGQSAFVEAHVCRTKKRKDGESNATIVSDAIPFVEYDLHRQLMYKLKIHGLNAIFGLRFQITVGDALIVAVASGTAMYLSALPTPPALRISRNLDVIDEEDKNLLDMQRRIMELSEQNRANIEAARAREADDGAQVEVGSIVIPGEGINPLQALMDDSSSDSSSDSEDEQERGNYQTNVVVQIDDDADEDLLAVLLDPIFTDGFYLCSTETMPNHPYFVPTDPMIPDNAHLITTVKQGHISVISHHPSRQLMALFRTIYEDLRFRLSYFTECVLAGITYSIQLPRSNEVQIQLTAVALGRQRPAELNGPLAIPATLSPWRSGSASASMSRNHSRAESEAGMVSSNISLGQGGQNLSPGQSLRAIPSSTSTSHQLQGASSTASIGGGGDDPLVFQMDECHVTDSPSRMSSSSLTINASNHELNKRVTSNVFPSSSTISNSNIPKEATAAAAATSSSSIRSPTAATTAQLTPARDRKSRVMATNVGESEPSTPLEGTPMVNQSTQFSPASAPPSSMSLRSSFSPLQHQHQQPQSGNSSLRAGSSSISGSIQTSVSESVLQAPSSITSFSRSLNRHGRQPSLTSSIINMSGSEASAPPPASAAFGHYPHLPHHYHQQHHLHPLDERAMLAATTAANTSVAAAAAAAAAAVLPMLPTSRSFIEVTPLSFIPGRTPTRYLGKLSLHFVKETHILHDGTVSSGMGGFVHVFLMEIQAVARAHVAAMGGDAIVGLRVDETLFQESVKNQGYALLSISGDVVGCVTTTTGPESDLEVGEEEEEEDEDDDSEDDDDDDDEDEKSRRGSDDASGNRSGEDDDEDRDLDAASGLSKPVVTEGDRSEERPRRSSQQEDSPPSTAHSPPPPMDDESLPASPSSAPRKQ
ncbi:hypothetical protein DFQ27_009447 [Actinomortierella ambigua]|uniref:C2 domain-containing protein n=1 Tax=Actinomortierella ambigua TaxID=1343610 RepID=A0A9P6QI92_9FUNG|nr:hypothetical protein DFQ27_009447 [Actinomortierella ambigua]